MDEEKKRDERNGKGIGFLLRRLHGKKNSVII